VPFYFLFGNEGNETPLRQSPKQKFLSK